MTNAVFNYKNDQFVSFQIKGHANYSEYGTDIVCAGITTATFTTLGLSFALNFWSAQRFMIVCIVRGHWSLFVVCTWANVLEQDPSPPSNDMKQFN